MRKSTLLLLLAIMMLISNTVQPLASEQGVAARRVNIPYSSGEVDWAQTAIFWFGENKQGVPSKNYIDVRMAYTAEALRVRTTVVDYYLWYKENPIATDDLTQYDAVEIYLDTSFDRAATPQTDDYIFLVGARHWPTENAPQYHRQARGTGAGWNTAWTGDWTDSEAMQWWCNPGPNSNTCGIDYGWTAFFTIPWETLGLSGPPAEGTVWGLGAQLYDRDDLPPAGYVAPEHWPETLLTGNPATWGELHFGYADYEPPDVVPEGTTMIRAASPEDNTVEDAWMGGGGTCSGGHEGGSEDNHGDSTNLFVGTETAPTHFPCFNKSYLRFSLDAIPAGKEIVSATLTLHHWGNAGNPGQAQLSWVHLFSISDVLWDEMAIHWNNAPLAQENIDVTLIDPDLPIADWPGNPYYWDATQAVAEAYATGQPVNLAIYSSDTAQHSSRYLVSSETGDWNVEGRPALTVVWGQEAPLKKSAQTAPAPPDTLLSLGGAITYTLRVLGSDQALTMTDVLPARISHPLTYTASYGSIAYDTGARELTWTGAPSAGQVVTITYPVTVTQGGTYTIVNTAHLAMADGGTSTASSTVIVEPWQAFLPSVFRQR